MNILNCPFCGSRPNFPESKDVYGTFYDAECGDCGIASISIQISDCFEFDATPSRDDLWDSWKDMKYGDKFIEIVRNEAIEMWNKRVK